MKRIYLKGALCGSPGNCIQCNWSCYWALLRKNKSFTDVPTSQMQIHGTPRCSDSETRLNWLWLPFTSVSSRVEEDFWGLEQLCPSHTATGGLGSPGSGRCVCLPGWQGSAGGPALLYPLGCTHAGKSPGRGFDREASLLCKRHSNLQNFQTPDPCVIFNCPRGIIDGPQWPRRRL